MTKKNLMGAAILAGAALMGGTAVAQDEELVRAATEEGSLLIYTTHGSSFWQSALEAFSEAYPGIDVEYVQLGGSEVWERYRAESATNVRTADLMTAGSPNQFVIALDRGDIMDFRPEGFEEHLGRFEEPEPGIIPLAIDVMSIIYNQALLPEELWPTSFADLAEKVAANPDVFNGMVASWDPFASNLGTGFSVALDRHYGEDYWSALADMSEALRFEDGATAMMEKVTSGEYLAAYLVSRSRISAMSPAQARLVGWAPFGGDEPANIVTAAIPTHSQNVNAAKLFVTFLVTPEAQDLLSESGLYVIHPEATLDDTYEAVMDAHGGVAIFGYGREFLNYEEDYLPRVEEAFGR